MLERRMRALVTIWPPFGTSSASPSKPPVAGLRPYRSASLSALRVAHQRQSDWRDRLRDEDGTWARDLVLL